MAGFEPAASRSQGGRSTKLSYTQRLINYPSTTQLLAEKGNFGFSFATRRAPSSTRQLPTPPRRPLIAEPSFGKMVGCGGRTRTGVDEIMGLARDPSPSPQYSTGSAPAIFFREARFLLCGPAPSLVGRYARSLRTNQVVEPSGIEPPTSCLQNRRSPF